MKIVYITASLPWGKGETFIIDEIQQMRELGNDILIIPRSPKKEIFHKDAEELVKISIWMPLINLKIFIIFLYYLLLSKKVRKLLFEILKYSNGFNKKIKNISVFPKCVYLSHKLKRLKIEHIHAHWGSTTATMAYIISKLTGIPWSMTLHRWDIGENNMLKEKVDHSQFTRCISEDGRRELLSIVGDNYKDKIKKVYMGVKVEKFPKKPEAIDKETINNQKKIEIICPANLVEKKGHFYLFKALEVLLERGINCFKCNIVGTGPLENELKELVVKLGLSKYVEFYGHVSHDLLLDKYRSAACDIVVLPSITIENGEREGIPVSLMEAMAFGIPVISTRTGGIPELLEGAGLLVNEKNYIQLADALEQLIKSKDLRIEMGWKGHQRVVNNFDIQQNTKKLFDYIINPE